MESHPSGQGGEGAGTQPALEEPADGQSAAQAEIQDYLEQSRHLHYLFPRAVMVGVLAGGLAVAFRGVLALAEIGRAAFVEWAQGSMPFLGLAVVMAVSAGAVVVAAYLVRRFAPDAAGSGIPQLKAVLLRLRELRWMPVMLVKFCSGALSLAAGLCLGREGPTVQMGGTVGAGVVDWMGGSRRDRLTLIAAGAGAGLAASFNAPLAGLLFVLEEMQRDFRASVFNAALIASVTADIVSRAFYDSLPVFQVPSIGKQAVQLNSLPAFAVIGIVAGLLGVLFNRSLLFTVDQAGKLSGRNRLILAGLVGALAGAVGWYVPTLAIDALGGGHHLAERALLGQLALWTIPLWFAARFAFLLFSYSPGTAGGIFAPFLVLGALIGLGCGLLIKEAFPGVGATPALMAVAGMSAYFAGIVRAPLTGVVLIVEMTGQYELLLPLMVASFFAYGTADVLGDVPIYEALLERDLKKGGEAPAHQEPMLLELEVGDDAPFAGKTVRELGLPPGCLLVYCRDGALEWVPTANTRIMPGMRITACVAPQAADFVDKLRHGCHSPTAKPVEQPPGSVV
jgi:CIC family chloride channel protein